MYYIMFSAFWKLLHVLKSSTFWDRTLGIPSIQLTFRRNISPPHLHGRRMRRARNHHQAACSISYLLYAGYLLGLFFGTGDGDAFFRNVDWLSMYYTVLYPKDASLHNYCCENLISLYICVSSFRAEYRHFLTDFPPPPTFNMNLMSVW
jgi:hypothetical protein